MAPNVAHVTPCQPSDIRVPPIFVTDPSVLNAFPELVSQTTGRLASSSTSSSLQAHETRICIVLPRRPSKSEVTPDKVEILRQEVPSSPSNLEVMKQSSSFVIEDIHLNESFLLENDNENQKIRVVSDSADDLFDSDYVLPANSDWWQISSSEIEEFPSTATPNDTDFDVVDVPHFGDSFNNSDLWEDVDTFVSVVDVSSDDVSESCDLHEPVYRLDTRVTTVWGLDIIWEEEEE